MARGPIVAGDRPAVIRRGINGSGVERPRDVNRWCDIDRRHINGASDLNSLDIFRLIVRFGILGLSISRLGVSWRRHGGVCRQGKARKG
jgi:hypothetical protein